MRSMSGPTRHRVAARPGDGDPCGPGSTRKVAVPSGAGTWPEVRGGRAAVRPCPGRAGRRRGAARDPGPQAVRRPRAEQDRGGQSAGHAEVGPQARRTRPMQTTWPSVTGSTVQSGTGCPSTVTSTDPGATPTTAR